MLHTFNCPKCQATVQADEKGIGDHQLNCGVLAADPRDEQIASLNGKVSDLLSQLDRATETVLAQATKIASLQKQP